MKKKDYNKYDFLDIQQDKLHNIKQKMLNKFLIDDILYIKDNYVYFCNKQYDGSYKIPKEVLNKLVKTEKHYKAKKNSMYGSIGGGVYRFYPTYVNNLYISTDCYYINKKHIKNIDEKVYGDNNVKYYNITMANDFNIDITTEYENLIYDVRSFKLKKLLGE